jgi:acyl transferase domain-containing protein
MKDHIPPPVASIAIIGASCQLPSGVDSTNALWDFCSKAQCSARPYPESRFKSAHYYHPAAHKQGHFNVRAGSFLDRDISSFDASFFNITATEAVSMDPQQRLLLECAFTALENAGLDLNELSGKSDIGVFAGGSKSDYDALINLDQFTATHYAATGNAMTMFANRISYFFNWRGPSITIDTACSSSLSALHAAVQSLRHGECSTALVGGSFLQLSPMLLSHMAAIGYVDPTLLIFLFFKLTGRRAVSPDGISYSFDARAQGYGRGEGAGCLVLRSTNDAIRARNTIRANIRNTGINHCGRSQGITVPKQEAQIELIRGVYAAANLDPTETAFVECHGTGTSKGDPIEARSIASAFKSSSLDVDDPLYIGSVKSNFGQSVDGTPPVLDRFVDLC